MTGFKVINLLDLINLLGEDKVKSILSEFYCPFNRDVQNYIRVKSIEFAKRRWGQTHLVYASFKDEPVMVGYFTLANKDIHIKKDVVSRTLRKKLSHFATFDKELDCYYLSTPLIAQLGKNYSNGYNKLISGDELLKIACDFIKQIQLDIGGKFTYLECEDAPKLVEFYERNGFCNFGKRSLDKDEKDDFSSDYLVQLIKYLR